MSQGIGSLKLTVVEANGLAGKSSDGTSNPYVKIKLGHQKAKTSIIGRDLNPRWNESFQFDVEDPNDKLKIAVFHKGKGLRDNFLGLLVFEIDKLIDQKEIDNWYTLAKRSKHSHVSGKLHLRMTYTPNPNATHKPEFLYVEVVEARTSQQSTLKNPIIKLRLGDEKYKAEFHDHGDTIVFHSKFKFKLRHEMSSSSLSVRLYDEDSKIGIVKIPLSEIPRDAETHDKWFPLTYKSKQTGQVHLLLSNGTPLKKKRKNKVANTNTSIPPSSQDDQDTSEHSQLSRTESMSSFFSDSLSTSHSAVEDTDSTSFSLSTSSRSTSKKKKKRNAFKFISPVVKFVDGALRPPTIGRLYVSVIEARLDGENPMTTQSFLCVCFFEKQKASTDPTKGPTPKWNDNFLFTVKDLKSEFKVVIYKEEEKSENIVAKSKIELSEVEEKKPLKKWFDLKSKKQKLSVGKILIRFKYEPYAEPLSESDEEEEDSELMKREPIGTVNLNVIEARNLSSTHHSRDPNPYCIVKCQGQSFQTESLPNTANPKWNEQFNPIYIRTSEAKLRFTVWDKDKKADKFLGIAVISISEAKSPDFVYDEWVPLQKRSLRDNITGDIHIRFKVEYTHKKENVDKEHKSPRNNEQLHVSDTPQRRMSGLNLEPVNEQSDSLEESSDVQSSWSLSSRDQEIKPTASQKIRGNLKVTIVEAKDLSSKNKNRDVFCKCIYDQNEYTTQMIRKTTNPQWNETINLNVTDLLAHKLRVGVFSMSKKGEKHHGHVSIPLSFLAEKNTNAHQHTNKSDNKENQSVAVDRWYRLEGSTRHKNNNNVNKILKKKKDPTGSLRLRLEFTQKKPELFSPDTQVPDTSKYDQIYKVILVGSSGVGKTCLFMRYMRDEYNEHANSTCGVDFETKTYEVNGKIIKVQLWDTAGQEKYKTIIRQYYRGAAGVLLVYDITNRQSFQRLDWWINEVKSFSDNPNCFMLLVGNKCDCSHKRVVSVQEGKDFAEKHKINFLETSAKERTNVDRAFQILLSEIYEFGKNHELPPVNDNPYIPTGNTITIKGESTNTSQAPNPNVSRCRC